MAPQELNLQGLARARPRQQERRSAGRRRWLTRYALPGSILLGFALLLVIAARDHWLPRQPVTVVPVMVMRAEVQQEGTPLFQAAGWVEPRPTPMDVPALTSGVVEELLVVEGEEVLAQQPVARLIDTDAELAVRRAGAVYKLRQAELEGAEAELTAARLRKENPVHIEAQLADAESLLAKTETARAQLPYLIKSAQARVNYARQNLAGKQATRGAIAQRLVQQAESELAKAVAELEELQQRGPRLDREADALSKKAGALSTQLNLLIEESRQLADAKARRTAAEAEREEAELAVEQAELALARTVVRASRAGRVLRVLAHPGTQLTGMQSMGNQESSTIVQLYDPAMLQVRADVRLEEVPLVQPGQPVKIETPSSSQPLRGKVLLPTSAANIQKNTLEVKVAIEDPSPTIRPEMLVTATFLAPPTPSSSEQESERLERLLIPRQLVQSDGDGQSVWIVDASGKAHQQAITLGPAGDDQLVEVVEGIDPTDKLISSGQQQLQPGMRVTIAGEDATLGLAANRS